MLILQLLLTICQVFFWKSSDSILNSNTDLRIGLEVRILQTDNVPYTYTHVHRFRRTSVCLFPVSLPLHTPSYHVLLRQEKEKKGRQYRKWSGKVEEGKYIPWEVIGAKILRPDALPVTSQCERHPVELILSSTINRLLMEGTSDNTMWWNFTKVLVMLIFFIWLWRVIIYYLQKYH